MSNLNIYPDIDTASFIFEPTWYVRSYNLFIAIDSAFQHYEEVGWKLGFNPSPLFDSHFYIQKYPDLIAWPHSPFAHYVIFGRREGRQPHPLFDPTWFASCNGTALENSCLYSFLKNGIAGSSDPHPLIDLRYIESQSSIDGKFCRTYLHYFIENNATSAIDPNILFSVSFCKKEWSLPDVSACDILILYETGVIDGFSRTHPLFDPRWYVQHYGIDASTHHPLLSFYLTQGLALNHAPHWLFDPIWYARSVGKRMVYKNSIRDYLLRRDPKACPHPLFSDAFYSEENRTNTASKVPLINYILSGKITDRTHVLFDGAWYLENNRDCLLHRMNPLEHYLTCGFREGRNPNAIFDEELYRCGRKSSIGDIPGLVDYCYGGWIFGAQCNPFFSEKYFLSQINIERDPMQAPLAQYIEWNDDAIDPHPDFVSAWYRNTYLMGTEPQIRPLAHFTQFGISQELDPAPWFDMKWRLGQIRSEQTLKNEPKLIEVRDYEGYPSSNDINRVSPTAVGLRNFIDARIGSATKIIDHRQSYTLLTMREGAKILNGNINQVREHIEYTNLHAKVQDISRSSSTYQVKSVGVYYTTLSSVLCLSRSRVIMPLDQQFAMHDEYNDQRVTDASPKLTDVFPYRGKLYFKPPVVHSFIDAGIHLMNEHDANYFHWIVEMLPRALISSNLSSNIPFILNKSLHKNMIELLRIVIGDRLKFVQFPDSVWIHAGTLESCSDISYIPDVYNRKGRETDMYIRSPELSIVRDKILDHFGANAQIRRKSVIYVSRERGIRRVLNEVEVFNHLDKMVGAENIIIEQLTLREQVLLFSSVDIIVSPTGASLTNILWCKPGTRVICLLSDHESLNPYIWQQLADISGVDLEFVKGRRAYDVVGRYSLHDHYTINPVDVVRAIT